MNKKEAALAIATTIRDEVSFVLETFRADGDPRWMGVMMSMLRGYDSMLQGYEAMPDEAEAGDDGV